MYKNYTYFNTGAFGPMPGVSYLKQIWHLMKQSKLALPTTTNSFALIDRQELKVKSMLGNLLDCCQEDLVLTPGITDSIYFALDNIPDLKNAEIVISEYEFSSMLIALQNYQAQYGLIIKVIPLCQDQESFLRQFKAAITERTSLVMISHVNFLFGKILPVGEIIAYANRYDVPVFVDGAQAVGATRFALSSLRPSYYAGTFVKWLHGPLGHGFLYIDEKQQKKIRNFKPGRRACENHSEILSILDLPIYKKRAWKAESSTYNYNNLFFIEQCLNTQLDHRIDLRVEYVSQLRKALVGILKKNQFVIHDEVDWDYAGIVSISANQDLSLLYQRLLDSGIIVKFFSVKNLLRISLCYLNNMDDINKISTFLSNFDYIINKGAPARRSMLFIVNFLCILFLSLFNIFGTAFNSRIIRTFNRHFS